MEYASEERERQRERDQERESETERERERERDQEKGGALRRKGVEKGMESIRGRIKREI